MQRNGLMKWSTKYETSAPVITFSLTFGMFTGTANLEACQRSPGGAALKSDCWTTLFSSVILSRLNHHFSSLNLIYLSE